MRLRNILDQKSHEVRTISSQASCDDVVTELVRFNIGSLIVRDAPGGPVLGIITERDILKAQAANRVPLVQLSVAKFMTSVLIWRLAAAPPSKVSRSAMVRTPGVGNRSGSAGGASSDTGGRVDVARSMLPA